MKTQKNFNSDLTDYLINNGLIIPISLLSILKPRECLVLSNLIKQQQITGTNDFIYPNRNQSEDLGLSEYEIVQSKKILKKSNFLKTERKGLPAMEYYSINYEKILKG